jgi:GT2 family glycosyltransferase
MTSPMRPLISVAILTWNRCHHVTKAIQSVLAQTYPNVEIVVVDSASSDDTVATILAKFPSVKVVRLHRNLGCPGGRNVALANCRGEFIFALDDDGWLAPNTLEICIDRFMKQPTVGVVCCRILPPGVAPMADVPDRTHYTFSGGASAIRKTLLDRAGYYTADYFRQGEESDLSLRIYDAGYTVLHCPDAVMYHEVSSINRHPKLFLFYGCRNDLYTIVRRYPWPWILPGFVQKSISWIVLGLQRGAFIYTFAGICAAAVQSPRLLFQRKPVSMRTMQTIFSLRWHARHHCPEVVSGPNQENSTSMAPSSRAIMQHDRLW